MGFQWGLVKNKVPGRFVNIARFTGLENREDVLKFVKTYKNQVFGPADLDAVNLVLTDHYIQKDKTKNIAEYRFKN